MNEFRLPIQVLVYCYRRSSERLHDIEYLMLRRVPKLGAFWQGVTGAPEEGESLLDAAARELREETQLISSNLRPVEFSYSFAVEDSPIPPKEERGSGNRTPDEKPSQQQTEKNRP